MQTNKQLNLKDAILEHKALISVIGLGYVGLPLAIAFFKAGFPVLGFDIDDKKVSDLNKGKSYILHIPSKEIETMVKGKRFTATSDFSRLKKPDVIIVCVPTPLDEHREPDMRYIVDTAEIISKNLRKGQLIILESTSYPGTTDEVMLPILEKSGLKASIDFSLGFSPEREDPGNPNFTTTQIPKVVAGIDPVSSELTISLYKQAFEKVVPVSSTRTAEAVKLTENIFRAVNIALVNELKMIYAQFGIDIWEVIETAKTKPFGFMPFYPGPGLGGHCIPIDPFYLTWKAREYGFVTRFIELAGEINTNMPDYVIDVLTRALNEKRKSVKSSRILILGIAYKKNVADVRESPAFPIIQKLISMGAIVDYYDPFVPVIGHMRKFQNIQGVKSIKWDAKTLAKYDASVIITDHSNVDYDFLVKHSKLVVDTRNATKNVKENRERIKSA